MRDRQAVDRIGMDEICEIIADWLVLESKLENRNAKFASRQRSGADTRVSFFEFRDSGDAGKLFTRLLECVTSWGRRLY
jgi:hypothetical protein